MSGLGFIAQEPDGECEMCGVVDELRPYGPNYEKICFECGMKNEELTDQRIREYVFGDVKKLVQ